ncbi:hypothetical protein WJX74_009066 [Apatococcus lobatus]|uniref:UDP-N-acetylglucosamine transferase subunit ALG14 n=1 Tax=Apatococcus lobatus TaxID=904363 RepID=A0AAW1QHZ9_9CHLO
MGRDETRTLIVLGSGGHTAEMLTLVKGLDHQRYKPRCYVAAVTDMLGLQKAQQAEANNDSSISPFVFKTIPRSREVGQSYISSIWTTLVAIWAAMYAVFTFNPDLVLVNGPGTCIPICLAAILLRLFHKCKIIYVESIARVNTLSLSAKILYISRAADAIMVQWPELQRQYPWAEYAGRLY